MDEYGIRKNSLEDLDVSREELRNITECLKKDEFRKLLIEYAEEVTDPENRKIYEKEITQLEKERGVDVTFVNPTPGYVIKTSVNGEKKCFLNISKNDIVARPSSQASYEQGHHGLQWSIPYILIPPRDDLDKRNVCCMVFDIVFHPDTIYLASKNPQFRQIVNNTAMDGVEKSFKVILDRKNLKYPRINFKGVPHPTVIRKASQEQPPSEPLDIEPEIYQKLMASYDKGSGNLLQLKQEKPQRSPPVTTYYRNKQQKSIDEEYITPKFSIKHQSDIEMEDFSTSKDAKIYAAIPKRLVITINLPLLKNANDTVLDVNEQSIILKSEKPAKYALNLPLPYSVHGDSGNAKFDTKYKKLIITLPVIRPSIPVINTRLDNKVDNDENSLASLISKDTKENSSSNKIQLMKKCENTNIYLNKKGEIINECKNNALLTDDITETIDAFMDPSIKYNFPAYICNVYKNKLAVTINVKNVDPNTIHHRILDNNIGIHILLVSMGTGFFPQHYSLCLKIADGYIEPETLIIEPWDNNVVFSITVKDIENITQYFIGMDVEFMEAKDLPTAASFRNKFKELMVSSGTDRAEKQISVQARDDNIIIDIRQSQEDPNDETERRNEEITMLQQEEKQHIIEKSTSISESSGDELANSNNSIGHSKGILKSRRTRNFPRSVSESSADENCHSASCTDDHYDFVEDVNSESDCSSLKKTVRFNDVVSRQLFRSNSSILGQRKKNQRKLRNKKRAHDRRMSESENSENEERSKYITNYKASSNKETSDNIKPILTRDKQFQQQNITDINTAELDTGDEHPLSREKSNVEEEFIKGVQIDVSSKVTEDKFKLEFKNDLIFDLDM